MSTCKERKVDILWLSGMKQQETRINIFTESYVKMAIDSETENVIVAVLKLC